MAAGRAHHHHGRSKRSGLELLHVADLVQVAGFSDQNPALRAEPCKLFGHLLRDARVRAEGNEKRLGHGVRLFQAILQSRHILGEFGSLSLEVGMALLQVRLQLPLELLRHCGRAPHELGIAVLAVQELHDVPSDLLGVEDEGVVPDLREMRIEAVEGPVATLDSIALVQGHRGETGLEEAVLNARGIAHQQGRPVILLGFGKGLNTLLVIRTNGHRSNIDVLVGHCHGPEVLLSLITAGLGELGHSSHGRGLRRLATGVGVDLGVQHHDLHVVATGNGVVDATIADVVGPTVSAEHPHRRLREHIFQADELGNLLGFPLLGIKKRQDLIAQPLGDDAILSKLQPLLEQAPQRDAQGFPGPCERCLHAVTQLAATLADVDDLAQSVLRVVLEQRVAPGGALA
mmetsp:Transcript_14990/g.35384  ORF Transcript_14990/g.35384 Transcript_14990/m.35384 type:complete len:402 (-) Transcript_14990:2832-4037(-)